MKRWVVVICDVNGKVLYTEWRFTRAAADKLGRQLSTPPLNSYTVLSRRVYDAPEARPV